MEIDNRIEGLSNANHPKTHIMRASIKGPWSVYNLCVCMCLFILLKNATLHHPGLLPSIIFFWAISYSVCAIVEWCGFIEIRNVTLKIWSSSSAGHSSIYSWILARISNRHTHSRIFKVLHSRSHCVDTFSYLSIYIYTETIRRVPYKLYTSGSGDAVMRSPADDIYVRS